VSDVKPGQVWEIRSNSNSPWKEARVVNVLGDEVELQYLDMPGATDLARTVSHSRALTEHVNDFDTAGFRI
jgi:hypothetical protein